MNSAKSGPAGVRKFGDPVRANYKVAEIMWDEGEWFFLAPRTKDGQRWAELVTCDPEQSTVETQLHFDLASLKLLQAELGALISWVESEA